MSGASSIASASSVVVSSSPDTESPTVQFASIKELFKQIDQVAGDILIVEGVFPQDLAEIEKES
ncbi:hypothetical protein AAE478_010351 [Parahypoxylon ruwenzoriense]